MFFLAGTLLLALTYLLFRGTLPSASSTVTAVAGTGALPLPRGAVASQSAEAVVAGGAVPVHGRTATGAQAATLLMSVVGRLRESALTSLLEQGAIALVVVGALASVAGYVLAERALRPVHEITATACRVAASAAARRGLHERIALSGPGDEVKELADTFDDMLERLDRAFDGQRRFVANASHELRTPLAINRAVIEATVTRPAATEDARWLARRCSASTPATNG